MLPKYWTDMNKPAVVIFVLVKDNKILVEKRPVAGFAKDQYLLPGGAINISENLEQALKREMTEELGVTPTKFALLTQEDITGLFDNLLKPFVVSEWTGILPQISLDQEDPYPLEWVEIDIVLTTPIEGSRKIVQALKKYLSLKQS